MKNFKKIAVLSSILMGSAMAQDSEQGLDSQSIDEFDQAMYQPVDKNAADYIDQKAYGNGYYYLSYTASGATSMYDSEYSYASGACVYQTSGGNGYFDMPLQIPDGHAIIGFRYYWYDNDNSAISNANLFKFNGAGTIDGLLTIESTDTSGYGDNYATIKNSSGVAEAHTVNNFTGSYVIRFYAGGTDNNTRICGVRLFINSTP